MDTPIVALSYCNARMEFAEIYAGDGESVESVKMGAIDSEFEVQLTELRDRVWIHAADGSTVGRFSRFGIDLHNTVTEQLAGMPQCRLCTHDAPTKADWELFRAKALEWWGVAVHADAFDQRLLK